MTAPLDVPLLARLVDGALLTRDEAREALSSVLQGDVEPLLVASFLTSLAQRGETSEEMAGFVDAMLAAGETFTAPPGTMDIVGTGGDRRHSVNISTMAALTVAGCGVQVAKHGNRAASSSVGTADVLEALGVKLDVSGDVVLRCVNGAGIGFCFAQRFHPGLRHLGPIRRALGFPTAFNVLGPLANPAGVRRLLIGVANEHMMARMADVLVARGVERAMLLRSDDGLDELSLGSTATIYTVEGDTVQTSRLDAAGELGIHHDEAELRGGTVDVNKAVVLRFLEGVPGAVFDVVTANAALALVVAGRATSLTEGFEIARDAVRSGAAANALTQLVALSNA